MIDKDKLTTFTKRCLIFVFILIFFGTADITTEFEKFFLIIFFTIFYNIKFKLKKISNIKNILLNKYHGINAHTKEKNQTNTNLIKFKIN